MRYTVQCVGGPLNGQPVDTDITPQHGRTVMLRQFKDELVPNFHAQNDTIEYKPLEYRYVIFRQGESEVAVLAFEHSHGPNVIRDLLNDSRRLTCLAG